MTGCGGGSGDANPNQSPPPSPNNPPSLSLNQAYIIAENSSLVAQIAFSDLDDDDISLSVGGVDGESFYINATNQLRFKFGPDFENAQDIDGDNNFEIEITASDGTDNVSRAIVIEISNQNENKFDELEIDNLEME